jgi:pheromone shutdown protein TraB
MESSTSVESVTDRLTLIGTIHVSAESGKLVSDTILRLKPRIVALELDEGRLSALMTPNASNRNPLRAGMSFLFIALLEKFAGEITGSAPGAEMLRAVEAARMVGSQIQFIDLPIQRTISAIRTLSRKEKMKLGLDSIVSIFFFPFAKLNMSRLSNEIENQISLFRQRYPDLSRILIDEREQYMARRLQELHDSTSGLIVAVVGYGHMKSLARVLHKTLQPRQSYSSTITWTLP